MKAHVAVVPFPFGSHIGSLFGMAQILAAAAPDVIFTYLCPARASAPLAAAALPNVRFCDVSDGLPSTPPASFKSKMGILLEASKMDMLLEAAPQSIREGFAAAVAAERLPVSCVLSDRMMWIVAEIAEEMAVPWVVFNGGQPGALSAHIYTNLIRQTLGVEDNVTSMKREEGLHFIPGLSAMRVRDLPKGILKDQGIVSLRLYKMGKELPRASAIAFNTFDGLHPDIGDNFRSILKEYLPIGPISLLKSRSFTTVSMNDAQGCLPWLDLQSPATVVYISFGTFMAIPPMELTALAEALEVTGIPFLWSLKEEMREYLPASFLERTSEKQGLLVSWAPQVQVLSHPAVGAFFTHCGWNSVMEGIACGVPMLCRSIFGDQMMSERMASEMLDIAVWFEDRVVTKETAARSLILVLKEEEGKKMKERICKLKNMAIEALGPEGISTKNFSRLLEIVSKA